VWARVTANDPVEVSGEAVSALIANL